MFSNRLLYILLISYRPELQNWTRHKRWPWIISGLNVNTWEGDKTTFLESTRNSNPVEASHAQSNQLGRNQSLLAALIKFVYLMLLKRLILISYYY